MTAIALTAMAAGQVSADAVVRTSAGLVRGVQADGVLEFRGNPYAASPTGVLRWALPQAPERRHEDRDANCYCAGCPQAARYGLTQAGYDEDCHSINVTVLGKAIPTRTAGKPVIAWIYVGAFIGGLSALDPLRETALVGGAVVSFNYRFGVSGFMSHSSFSPRRSSNRPFALNIFARQRKSMSRADRSPLRPAARKKPNRSVAFGICR